MKKVRGHRDRSEVAAVLNTLKGHFIGLHLAVPIQVGPGEERRVLTSLRPEINALGPERLKSIALEQFPISRAAERGCGTRNSFVIAPNHRDPRAARWVAIVAVGEIPTPLRVIRLLGQPGRAIAIRQWQVGRTGPIKDAHQLVSACLPVQAKFHAMIIKAGAVLRIELAAASILRRSIKGASQLTNRYPLMQNQRGW
jgi:hypothetical protein